MSESTLTVHDLLVELYKQRYTILVRFRDHHGNELPFDGVEPLVDDSGKVIEFTIKVHTPGEAL